MCITFERVNDAEVGTVLEPTHGEKEETISHLSIQREHFMSWAPCLPIGDKTNSKILPARYRPGYWRGKGLDQVLVNKPLSIFFWSFLAMILEKSCVIVYEIWYS